MKEKEKYVEIPQIKEGPLELREDYSDPEESSEEDEFAM